MCKVAPWLLAGFFAATLTGCGGDDSGKKKKDGEAAAGLAPQGMPAGGFGPRTRRTKFHQQCLLGVPRESVRLDDLDFGSPAAK